MPFIRFCVALTLILVASVHVPMGAAHWCVGPSGSCGVPCPTGWYHDHTEIGLVSVARCTYPYYPPYCPDQPVHSYGMGTGAGGNYSTHAVEFTAGTVLVTDTNTGDCGTGPAGWDGDYDWGVGGGFFGHGQWAWEPECNYFLNAHGPNVVVNDAVFGISIAFVTGENDRDGPMKIWNPATGTWVCETDGSIRPGDPDEDPTADPDDCISEVFVGWGTTCGEGGGDGGYWVMLLGAVVGEGETWPPTTGTITAF